MFLENNTHDILGTISIFDRVIITGSIIPISFVNGLSCFLILNNVLLKNFIAYATRLANILKDFAKQLAEQFDVPYKYLENSKVRNEEIIDKIIKERGDHAGLVAILSGLEVAQSFDINKNKNNKKLELVSRQRKCLHIYYYFVDELFGLCYFRIQTFFPFKIQIYFNGHNWLANRPDKAGIVYQKHDNCFSDIGDIDRAQQIADDFYSTQLHTILDSWTEQFVPILPLFRDQWNLSYHWSIKQIEYAKDIIFYSQQKLELCYHQLLKHITVTILPRDIMSLLGKKLTGPHGGKIETSTKKTFLGYRIKHRNGPISLKIYNKMGNVLRIELTINDVRKFKIYRQVEQKNGPTVEKFAPLKKSIHSIRHIINIGRQITDRYIDYLSTMKDNSSGIKQLRQITERKTENGKNYQGFNPLKHEDSVIFQALLNGAHIINGFRNMELRTILAEQINQVNWSQSKVSRLIRRLRVFGFVKRYGKSYRYYISQKGLLVMSKALALKELYFIPAFTN